MHNKAIIVEMFRDVSMLSTIIYICFLSSGALKIYICFTHSPCQSRTPRWHTTHPDIQQDNVRVITNLLLDR